jgi:hypothetical protein
MGPRTVVALLGEDRKWRCEDLLTQTYLNSCHGSDQYGDREDNAAIHEQAHKAAKSVEQAGWDVNIYIPGLNQNVA